MKAWFTEFGDKYDTVGTTRNLTTPTGKATTVTGGTYDGQSMKIQSLSICRTASKTVK